jgi:phosphopantothenoylcysteine decarboxylase/phosphopantothenate--cysteine ligase
VNDVAGEGVGIDSDTNAATFLTRATAVELPQMPKRQLADRIFDEILTLRRPRHMVEELDPERNLDERDVEERKKQAIQTRVLDESVPVGAGRRQLIVE